LTALSPAPQPSQTASPPSPILDVYKDLEAVLAAVDGGSPGSLLAPSCATIAALETGITNCGDEVVAAVAREFCENIVELHVPTSMQSGLRRRLVAACTLPKLSLSLISKAAQLDGKPREEQERLLAELVTGSVKASIDRQNDCDQKGRPTILGRIKAELDRPLMPTLGVDSNVFVELLQDKRRELEEGGKQRWAALCRGECDGETTPEELIASIQYCAMEIHRGKNSRQPWEAVDDVYSQDARKRTNPILVMKAEKANVPPETIAHAVVGLLARSPGLKFFHTDESLSFILAGGQVLEICEREQRFNLWLAKESALLGNSPSLRAIVSGMRNYTLAHGLHKESSPSWTSFRREPPSLFFHAHRLNSDRVYKVTADGVVDVDNGCDDTILAPAPGGEVRPLTYLGKTYQRTNAVAHLRSHVLERLPCSDSDRLLMLFYTLAAPLRDAVNIRPILNVRGHSGSGKTSGAKRLTVLLYGRPMAIKSTTAAAYSTSARRVVFVLDNKEELSPEDLEFLMLVATGAVREKRAGNTDTGVVRERPNCLVMVTGIEPHGLNEIRNRILLVNMSREWWTVDPDRGQPVQEEEQRAYNELAAYRDEIMSYYLDVLAESVLPAFQKGEFARERSRIQDATPPGANVRAIDYLALMSMVMRAMAPDLGYDPDQVLSEWVRSQSETSREDRVGGSSVVQALEAILAALRSGENSVKSKVLGTGVEGVISQPPQPGHPERIDILKGTAGAFLSAARNLLGLGFESDWKPATWGIRVKDDEAAGTLMAAGWEFSKQDIHGGTEHTFKRQDAKPAKQPPVDHSANAVQVGHEAGRPTGMQAGQNVAHQSGPPEGAVESDLPEDNIKGKQNARPRGRF